MLVQLSLDVRGFGSELAPQPQDLPVRAVRITVPDRGSACGPVDAVIDLVGGDVAARSLAVLRPGGSLVSAVAPPDQAAAERLGVDARFFLVEVTTARLTRIAAMLDAGAADQCRCHPAVGRGALRP